MIRIKLIVSILLFLIYSIVAFGQPRTNPKKIKTKGDYTHTAANTKFPEILYDYPLKSVYSYDKKNTDIGATYETETGNQKTTISIYIYPANEGAKGRLRNEYLKSLQEVNNASELTDDLYFNELNSKLQSLLLELTPRQREIFLLSREEGLTHDEIAKKLGISANTVKNHIVSVLNFLKSNIDNTVIINALFVYLFL